MGSLKVIRNYIHSTLPTGTGWALDLGCGTESCKKEIIGRGYRYIGVDIALSKDATIRCDAHHLPFKSQTFNLVFSSQVLEHVKVPEMVVNEIYWTLKNGGNIFISVPFLVPFHSNDYWRFSPLGLRHLFKGFSDLNISTPGHIFSILGHFIGNVLNHIGRYNKRSPFTRLGKILRDYLSCIDPVISRFSNFSGWAHTYIITGKKPCHSDEENTVSEERKKTIISNQMPKKIIR